MVRIVKSIIKKGQSKQRPGIYMNPAYITVHNTANTSRGADAEMHSRYLHNGGGNRYVGWHFTVDDKVIYQHLPVNETGYHAGDGSGNGNRKSIGIEIAENSDGNFEKAVENAQWLINKLMKENDIALKNVVTHKHWSGKNCPRKLLHRWSSFKNGIQSSKSTSPSTPSSGVKWVGTNNKGKELIVDTASLNYYDSQRWTNPTGSRSRGFKWKIDNLYRVDGSLQYRVQDANGRLFYTSARSDLVKIGGTYRGGSSRPNTPSRSKGDMNTTSIVTYLNSIGVNSSFSNRQRLASQYGISGYRGTASQNTRLLNLMRGGGSSSSKSISQMATEVINGQHGNGHANRRRSLGISQSEYAKVRAEVNRRS